MLEALLSKKDVARILGITPNSLAHMASVAKFPKPHHLGRKAVWPESVVKAWLAANLVAPDDTIVPEDRFPSGGGLVVRPLSASVEEVVAQ